MSMKKLGGKKKGEEEGTHRLQKETETHTDIHIYRLAHVHINLLRFTINTYLTQG